MVRRRPPRSPLVDGFVEVVALGQIVDGLKLGDSGRLAAAARTSSLPVTTSAIRRARNSWMRAICCLCN